MVCTSWQHHDHLPLSLPLFSPLPYLPPLALSLPPLLSVSLMPTGTLADLHRGGEQQVDGIGCLKLHRVGRAKESRQQSHL